MNGAKPKSSFESQTSGNSSIFHTIRNHKRLIASVTLAVSILTTAYSLLAYSPQYASSASVVIKDSALTAKYLTNDQYSTTTSQTSNPVLNTMELLKSDYIAEAIWRDVLSKHPEEQERLKINDVEGWKKRFGTGKKFIKSKNVPGTDVIYLNFMWTEPKIAQEGLDSVLGAFQEVSLQQNQAEHRQRYIYLSNQANELRTELARLRENIATYKKNNHIIDLQTAVSNYQRTRSDIESSSKVAHAEAQNYRTQLSAYEGTLGMSPERAVSAVALGRSSLLSQLNEELYTLTAEKSSLTSRYTAEHPKMKELSSKIAQLKENITREIARSGAKSAQLDPESKAPDTPPVKMAVIADETRSNAVGEMLTMQAKFKGTQAQSQGLKNALQELDSKMAKIPEAEATLANLNQDENALSSSLKILDEKVLEAKIRETQTLSNVFILARSSMPGSAEFPNKVQMIILGVMLGLAGGVGLAHARQLMLNAKNRPVTTLSSREQISLESLLSVEQQKAEREKELTLIN